MRYHAAGLALAFLCNATWVQAVSAAPAEVRLPAVAHARAGLRIEKLVPVSAPRVVRGFARVLDAGTLATLDAELHAAEAAGIASGAELKRVLGLAAADQAASARMVDAARAQADADDARARLANRRVGLEWGAGLVRLAPAARAQLLRDLSIGKSALLRVDLLAAVGMAEFPPLRVYPDGAAGPVAAEVLGPAAGADPRLQTPGLLAVVHGDYAALLPAGRLVRAEADASVTETGTILPRGALIRSGGAVWAYVQTGPERFVRRDATGGRAVVAGWFVTSGFRAGDAVVAAGAGSLFAEEQSAADGAAEAGP